MPNATGPVAAVGPQYRGGVPRNVVVLGLTSFFTDISSEALTAILPLYFVLELRMTPVQFGLLDGLYQGASALVRVAGGLVTDAGRRYKLVAFLGYALSAICKLGLLLVGSAWAPIAALLMIDRLGKGIRTAPRDALITRSSEPSRLGAAFGLHRTLDTAGAALGPVVAFAVLAAAPGAYDAVFVVSLAAALVGLAVLGLFAENHGDRPDRAAPAASARARLGAVLARRRFLALLVTGGLLGLATASDALIYLLLQGRGTVSPTLFPLLFVGTATVYLILALPAGRLADRWGRHRVFLAGQGLVLGIYGLLLVADLSAAGILACVALLGAYYAATDGVLAALAASVLSEDQLSTGLAIVGTTTALSRLLASSLFGALWSWHGPTEALAVFGLGLFGAAVLAAVLLRVARPWTPATAA
ncbi:MAG: MFS transporter [Gammaproteobacteria bacterium]